MKTRAKHVLMNAAKWLLSLGALYYVLREIDFSQLRSMITEQQPFYLIIATLLLLLQAAISTFRWQKIITLMKPEAQFSFRPLFAINYISMFFNTCLPGTIGGDIIRVLMVKSHELPVSAAAYSVIIDRLIAVIGIVLMVALGLPYLAPLLGWNYGFALMLAIIAAIGFAAAFMLLALIAVGRLPENRVKHMLTHFLDYMICVVSRPVSYSVLLIQALLAHAAFCLSVYFIAASLGVALSFFQCLLLVPPMLLISLIPISVGGWGVREVSMVYLLGLVGVAKEPALLISIQLGVLMMAACLPAIILWLKHKKTT